MGLRPVGKALGSVGGRPIGPRESPALPPSRKQRGALRVLLVTQNDEELRAFGLPLHRERISVTRVRDAAGMVEALRDGAFDAAIVSHPLPDADVIASCASLRQIPGAPPVILLDALDPNAQTFPASIRPARMLRKPVDAVKLGVLVREVVEGPDEEPPEPEPSTAPLALASALLQLASARETGVLEVRSGAVRTRIFLQAGAPVSTEGGSLRETLGRMLLRRGELAEADYVRVIERMTEQVMANEHQRMGEVLVELGLLSSEDVHRALAAQAVEKVTACFQWTNASWTFAELDALPEELEPFSLPPTERLVLAGLREHAAPEALAAWLAPHASARPRLKRPLAALAELLDLDAAALLALERLDGSRTLDAVARQNAALPALLATLRLIDALELGANAPPGERPKETVRVALRARGVPSACGDRRRHTRGHGAEPGAGPARGRAALPAGAAAARLREAARGAEAVAAGGGARAR